jgi:hypothetical protein
MTGTEKTDLDVVLSALDELHDGLTAAQQEVLSAIVAKAAAGPADDEVTGFLLGDELMLKAGPVKPSTFKPTLKGYTNGWGQDVI